MRASEARNQQLLWRGDCSCFLILFSSKAGHPPDGEHCWPLQLWGGESRGPGGDDHGGDGHGDRNSGGFRFGLFKKSKFSAANNTSAQDGFQSVLIADIIPPARSFSSLFISLARSHHWKSILSNGDLICYTDLSFHHSWEVFLRPEVHFVVTLVLQYL